ncbi:beta-hexosaminidase-like [Haliotis asinina]|uniref:beta-hexosaminidase-like n=1 Tax=Haliotis asinina TaxID=109174 RepID=UPI0035322517
MSSVTLSRNRATSRVIELRRGNPDVRVDGVITSSPEAYTLTVDPGRQVVTIVSRDPAGAFYGVQSLLSLCRDGSGRYTGEVPRATVRDAPRYEYRGLHMEVARNFRSKEEVMKVMNVMATYKMNRFLFHLGDDEGWRLEIPGLPELTRVGGRRCHDLSETNCLLPQLGSGEDNSTSGSGFYTVEDYREIIRYAADRHIQVIEMFDMPGHSRAAIVAMQARQARLRELGDPTADAFLLTDADDNLEFMTVQNFDDNMVNPCLDSTYRFLRHVLQEVQRMRRDVDPMRTYHFVGGEVRDVFVNSSACRRRRLDRNGVREYFAEQVSRIAADLRINLSGWVDGLMDTNENPLRRLSNIHIAMVWNNAWSDGGANRAYRMANAGYKVVLGHSTHLYLDHPQEPDPRERGLFWATRYTDARKMFWYMPDDVYSNVDVTYTGEPLTRQGYCARGPDMCLPLQRPRNVIGIQAQMFSEMTRTAGQQEGLLYPRLLAVAERAWHRAKWENVSDDTARNTSRVQDWSRFANTLGYKELPFLDSLGVAYRLPLPGARGQGRRWNVNTEYPNHNVQVSYGNGGTWNNVVSDTVTAPDEEVPHFRTRSPGRQRYSRVVPSSSVNVAASSTVVGLITSK